MQRTIILMILIVGTSLCLSGCKFLRSIGRPDGSLGGRGIQSMQIQVPQNQKLCPGSSTQLKLIATSHEGDTYSTDEQASWGNFDISMRGGVVSTLGKLQMSGDPRLSWKHPAIVDVVLLHNPKVRTSLKINPRYDCHYRAHFSEGRGKALSLSGTLDIVGQKDGQPIARLILESTETRRGGVFYLAQGATVEVSLAVPVTGTTTSLHIRVDPEAEAFRTSIRLSPKSTTESKDQEPARLTFTEEELFLP